MAAHDYRLRLKLAEAQNWRCCYCGGMMSPTPSGPMTATRDHVVPRSRGGGNRQENLVAACLACNSARGGLDAAMFSRLRPRLTILAGWTPCTLPNRRMRRWLSQMKDAREPKTEHRFEVEAVLRHIRQHHPSCPAGLAEQLSIVVARQSWSKRSIGFAFGCVSTNYVRTHLTDFRKLLAQPGMTPFEARLIVAPEVNAQIARWRISAEPL